MKKRLILTTAKEDCYPDVELEVLLKEFVFNSDETDFYTSNGSLAQMLFRSYAVTQDEYPITDFSIVIHSGYEIQLEEFGCFANYKSDYSLELYDNAMTVMITPSTTHSQAGD